MSQTGTERSQVWRRLGYTSDIFYAYSAVMFLL
jgi:hypothetical protein